MMLRRLHGGWSVPMLAMVLGACRGRPAPAVDWQVGAGERGETAALLMLDPQGGAKVACLPGQAKARQDLPAVALRGILDVGWQGGPVVAGWAAETTDAEQGSGDELVLLVPHQAPRRLAKGVRSARLSPDASALAYVVGQAGAPGMGPAPVSSYVLELADGRVSHLGELVDPRWEADGKHLRATRLRTAREAGPTPAVQWTSLRARWDRDSGTTTFDGPGAAQIPAPAGTAVAWTEDPRGALAPSQCTVLLSPRGGVRHSVVGKLCMGIADDREVRWSPDGRWLAFPHPPTASGQGSTGSYSVDVVSVEGGRHPALSALHARAGQMGLAIAVAPGSPWFDWSPSGRFLALQDGANALTVYDFEAQRMALLGKGRRPRWSPGGRYLLILADGQGAEGSPRNAVVLRGAGATARMDLGPVLDVRWLPAVACEPA